MRHSSWSGRRRSGHARRALVAGLVGGMLVATTVPAAADATTAAARRSTSVAVDGPNVASPGWQWALDRAETHDFVHDGVLPKRVGERARAQILARASTYRSQAWIIQRSGRCVLITLPLTGYPGWPWLRGWDC